MSATPTSASASLSRPSARIASQLRWRAAAAVACLAVMLAVQPHRTSAAAGAADGAAAAVAAGVGAGSRRDLQQAAPAAAGHELDPGWERRLWPEGYLAACAATKDRADDLREWVDYHHALGVSRFYIFSTDSMEPYAEALRDLIDAGVVEYHALPYVTPRTIPLMQVRLYYLCLKHNRERHGFLGFWDIDEYLVFTDPAIAAQERPLPAYLRRFDDKGGLVVNWRIMGSSGHKSRPEGGTIRSYLSCTPADYHENHQLKSIVNTRFVDLPTTDPHHFIYLNEATAVDTSGAEIEGSSNPSIRGETLVLFHYAIKSEQEYREKMARGSAMGNHKTMTFFERIDVAATEACPEALEACRRWGLRQCQDGRKGPRGVAAAAAVE